MHNQFLTPEDAREFLAWRGRRNAELRAQAPAGAEELYAKLFPPISDEMWRYLMERSLLGEFRHPASLPPLDR
jgi:hypothetical protein